MIPLAAAVLGAVRETPARIWDALRDPVRLRQSVGRLVETVAPAFVLLLVFGHGWRAALVGAVLIHVGEFLLYEWVLEPLGIAGHYFERGPRWGETFRRP